MAAEIHYENGNLHTPVVVIGEDPSDENNVLVSRLASAVSVPKGNVSQDEGTTEAQLEALSNPGDDKSVIARLEARLAVLEGNREEDKEDENKKDTQRGGWGR